MYIDINSYFATARKSCNWLGLGASACIISTDQQAKPNVIGHKELALAQPINISAIDQVENFEILY
ncbi:hypothetical protein PsorP6_019477 [Peronosclerospora sorghi]|nr:hypothetical protein PsorP6_019477 [Peronosclerospora sorghi]